MSTQEEPLEIIIDYYKFKNFCLDGNSVIFNVECTYKDADDSNRAEIELMMKDMGKWDCLVYSGDFLLSNLKNIQSIPKNALEKYHTKFGADLYKPAVVTIVEKGKTTDKSLLKVKIELTDGEYQKREGVRIARPVLRVDEIMKQVENIPKWIVFQKTLSNIREVTP